MKSAYTIQSYFGLKAIKTSEQKASQCFIYLFIPVNYSSPSAWRILCFRDINVQKSEMETLVLDLVIWFSKCKIVSWLLCINHGDLK